MDIDIATEILREFYGVPTCRTLTLDERVIGVQIEVSGGLPSVVVIVESDVFPEELRSTIPRAFTSSLVEQEVAIEFREGKLPRPIIADTAEYAGMAARGIDLQGYGTLGWNILLNGQECCLSNFHVFCGLGNSTPFGRSILVEERDVAELKAYQPIDVTGSNHWDYALGRYRPGVAVRPAFVQGEGGSQPPYPTGIARTTAIGDRCFKVGARAPIYREGRLVAVGDKRIKYSFGTVWFRNQLICSKMTDPGDSGSLCVRARDNRAMGLNFAAGDSESIASPLKYLPWRWEGELQRPDGSVWPMFVGNGDDSGWNNIAKPRELSIPQINEAMEQRDEDRPGFTAGLLFLGVAEYAHKIYRSTHKDNEYIYCKPKEGFWTVPIPPPFREVAVQSVWLDPSVETKYGKTPTMFGAVGTEVGTYRRRCLCFG